MDLINMEDIKKSITNILRGADLNSISTRKIRKQLEEEYNTSFLERKKEIDQLVMTIMDSFQEEILKEEPINSAEIKKSIEKILYGADLSTISTKEIRKQLEEEHGIDFSDRKKEIDKLVMDVMNSIQEESKEKKSKAVNTSEKVKSEDSDSEVDDAALARKLQQEERESRKRAVKKQTVKKEKKTQVMKKKKDSVYTRKCILSAKLANVVGCTEMARPQVLKKIWSLVRERNLLDPKNKQYAICDEQLKSVFGIKRLKMFRMMKYLKNHIKNIE